MELALGLLGLLIYDNVKMNNNRKGSAKIGMMRSSRLNFCCAVFDCCCLFPNHGVPDTMRENNYYSAQS